MWPASLRARAFFWRARVRLDAKVDFEWDLFVTPKHPKVGKRGISANDNTFVATKDTKNPEAAYKLALFYADSFSAAFW